MKRYTRKQSGGFPNLAKLTQLATKVGTAAMKVANKAVDIMTDPEWQKHIAILRKNINSDQIAKITTLAATGDVNGILLAMGDKKNDPELKGTLAFLQSKAKKKVGGSKKRKRTYKSVKRRKRSRKTTRKRQRMQRH